MANVIFDREIFGEYLTKQFNPTFANLDLVNVGNYEGEAGSTVKYAKVKKAGEATKIGADGTYTVQDLQESEVDITFEAYDSTTRLSVMDVNKGGLSVIQRALDEDANVIGRKIDNLIVSAILNDTDLLTGEIDTIDKNSAGKAVKYLKDNYKYATSKYVFVNSEDFDNLTKDVNTVDASEVITKVRGFNVIQSDEVPAGSILVALDNAVKLDYKKQGTVEQRAVSGKLADDYVSYFIAGAGVVRAGRAVLLTKTEATEG